MAYGHGTEIEFLRDAEVAFLPGHIALPVTEAQPLERGGGGAVGFQELPDEILLRPLEGAFQNLDDLALIERCHVFLFLTKYAKYSAGHR